jgi:hypothetical protein
VLEKFNPDLDSIYITFPEKNTAFAAVRVILESVPRDEIYVVHVKNNKFSHKFLKKSENEEGLHVDDISIFGDIVVISINHHHKEGYKEESVIKISKDDI